MKPLTTGVYDTAVTGKFTTISHSFSEGNRGFILKNFPWDESIKTKSMLSVFRSLIEAFVCLQRA